jgi:hypothetical protein
MLAVGDRVIAEGIAGQGTIRKKSGRAILLKMDDGHHVLKDRALVHGVKNAT